MKKKREPGAMPQEVRLIYARILGSMLLAENRYGAQELLELYRAMHGLKLKEKDRRVILEFLMAPDMELDRLCQKLMEIEDLEERNLIRFTLLEDLYRIMQADHYEGRRERDFLTQTARLLNIRDEHMEQIEQSYTHDGLYIPGDQGVSRQRRVMSSLTAGFAGLAVPLFLAASSRQDGRKLKGMGAPFGRIHGRKRKERFMPEIIMTLATGMAAFQSVRWLWRLPDLRQHWMKKKLIKEQKKRWSQIVKSLDYDKRLVKRMMARNRHEFMETESMEFLLDLLHRAYAAATAVQYDVDRQSNQSGQRRESFR